MARKNLLKGFKRPKGISFEHGELCSDYGKFVASPFEPGFGTTVGNTLRRVLLSSIKGYAITAVKISSYNAESVAHVVSSEFEAVPNIMEDTLEVINNLKQIRLRLPEDTEQDIILYEWSGQREIKSDDFERTGQVEVLSKGQHIMTLMNDARLDFQIQIDLARGYVSAEENDLYIEEINTIPLDAIFSPVKKVKYSVDPVRVGQRADFEKLSLELWTDGTIKPEDALGEAAKIIKDYFMAFINFDENAFIADDADGEIGGWIQQLLSRPVEELELSVRSSNCLKNASIRTIGELIRKTEDELTKTRNFGKKSLQEIKEKLRESGLGLGITDLSALRNMIKLSSQKEKEAETHET
ncbi:MAG: DNA-directed RNA polymerase subunit alpha [Treponema sp.]|jgi:DNA-directed RNA polymerase subunit alpha|nr:DNA-directed RNA polymerase subunit alpha [Treponema sp.]